MKPKLNIFGVDKIRIILGVYFLKLIGLYMSCSGSLQIDKKGHFQFYLYIYYVCVWSRIFI
jgi:hypothetical protein